MLGLVPSRPAGPGGAGQRIALGLAVQFGESILAQVAKDGWISDTPAASSSADF